jgi:ribulose-phosphate 3-epimerase
MGPKYHRRMPPEPTSAPERPIQISPSVLSADFSRLGDQVAMLDDAGADRIHWDVMDGVFVPNLTFGPDVVAACRDRSDLLFEAHLMVDRPELLAPMFVDAGIELVTLHVESTPHLDRALHSVLDAGARCGVTMTPSTPAVSIAHVLHLVDIVLVMTVNPGFGGQRYIAEQEPKIREIRSMIDERGLTVDVEVDGGIGRETIGAATTAGANVFVAGSAVFGDPDGPEAAIAKLRSAATAAR